VAQPWSADHARLDGAIPIPSAYSTPEQPWASTDLKPYFYCADGSSGFSCGDGVWVSYVFYELDEDDEWVPQPASAGIRPPANCLFLDDAGNLKLNEDGTVNTSTRDARIDDLLSKYGLSDTYETHHIVTKYANENDPVKQAIVAATSRILAKYNLGIESGFNKVVIPHEGPHPAKYHEWVRDNIREIDEVAKLDTNEFLRLFDERITQQILLDPTIVLKDYWSCR
jgi:hypothetical protein